MSDAELDQILIDIGGQPAVKGGYDTPTDPIKTSSSPVIKTGGGGGGGGGEEDTPEQIINQGISTVKTEKAGLADIGAMYNPSLSFAENMALLRVVKAKEEEEDAVNSTLMYGGGIVQPTDINDEIDRLLRGY